MSFKIEILLIHSYTQSAIFLRSVRMTTHSRSSFVGHARDNWWTLDFANAFVSPGVNSRGELVPSHGASRRRLGENSSTWLKNDPSDENIGEVILKINVVAKKSEKIKAKVYVNEHDFLSHIKPPTRQWFPLSFLHELLMRFLN
jgi:hypothetical protein